MATQHAFDRLGKKIQPPPAQMPAWGAPHIPDLIDRIDAALRARRAN